MGKIISNGIEYSGIQGTTVIANPQGTPTDELSSIQIGSDIYSISGGSGGDILIKDRNWTLLADTYGTTQLANTYDYYLFVIIQQGNDAYGLRLEDAHIIDSTVVDLESADRLYYSKAWKDNRGAYTTSGVEILPTEITLYSDSTQTVSCKLYGANAQSCGGGSASWTDVTGTLTAGQTSITLNNGYISDNCTFDFYTSKFGVNPTNVELTIQKIKVLRQELVSQQSDLDVTVTANSNWSGYDPWKAFGNSTVNSGWIGNGGNPHWLQIEFDTATSIREIDFISRDASRSHAISRVGYSNDGTNFEECGIETSTMTNNVGHCELDKDYEAKYFRLYFDGSYAASTYPMVSELEIYGYDEDPQGQKSITLTFDEQNTDLDVKVRITNETN